MAPGKKEAGTNVEEECALQPCDGHSRNHDYSPPFYFCCVQLRHIVVEKSAGGINLGTCRWLCAGNKFGLLLILPSYSKQVNSTCEPKKKLWANPTKRRRINHHIGQMGKKQTILRRWGNVALNIEYTVDLVLIF
jgi:hypothetical protein